MRGGLVYGTDWGGLFLLFASSGAGAVEHQLAAWRVEDLAAEVAELRARGVVFEEYDQPGLRTVDGHRTNPGRERRMVQGQRGQRPHPDPASTEDEARDQEDSSIETQIAELMTDPASTPEALVRQMVIAAHALGGPRAITPEQAEEALARGEAFRRAGDLSRAGDLDTAATRA